MAHRSADGAKAGALFIALAVLGACVSSERLGGGQTQQAAAPPPAPTEPPPPPPPPPPPVDLAGKWKLSAASGGACVMTFGNTPASVNAGTIAPAGGCPGNFFMSRKWTFEHDKLIVRDYKSEVLVELSFAGGRFEGKELNGAAISLARP